MTLIEKSRNYNLEEIVKQETIKAFYDKLYETFNSRPYLYDICKDLIDNGLNDYHNFEIFKLVEWEDDYIPNCHKKIKITSTIYNNTYIQFTYEYETEIGIDLQTYFLNVSVCLQFDHGKPVFSAISFNKDNCKSLLEIEEYYHLLDYGFSNNVLDEKYDAKVYGFISDNDRKLDVEITPSDFAYGIRKAIIS